MKPITSLVLLNLISFCCGAKILGIFPICSRSHYILGEKLLKELAKKGHEVIVISPFASKSHENYEDVTIEELSGFCREINYFSTTLDYLQKYHLMITVGYTATDVSFESAKVKNLLHSNASFDLVIVDMMMNHAHLGLAHHFNASLILFSGQPPNEWTKNFLRHPQPFVYVPSVVSKYSYIMSTSERILNMFAYVFYDFYDYFYVIPKHNNLLKKHLPNSPTISELTSSIDLVLYNTHLSSTIVVPKLPNMIEVGGFHIETKRKKLRSDIQAFLDGATDGAIYFSMGTNVKSSQFPIQIRKTFLSVFSRLKQRVLWKWENDEIEGASDNVKIEKWLSQQDILAHPNVKLFITHCGLLSIIESVYFGIPIMGIPIFGDQSKNCAISKTRGIALVLEYQDITKNTLWTTLTELLNNPKYVNNSKFASKILKDQDMKPMDRAIFWIEYVLRHKGAKHLQIHGMYMPWYQYQMIDIIVIFCVFIITFVLVCCSVIRKCRKCLSVYHSEKLKNN